MSAREEMMARAGDFVLGLADATEMAAAERELQENPEFRAAVAGLRRHFQLLDDTVRPQPASRDLWASIEQRVAGTPQAQVATDAPPSVLSSPLARRPAPWRSAWQPALMAASLLAAAGLGYLAGAAAPDPSPVVVVVLDTPEATPGAIFEAFADDTVRIVPLADFAVPQGQTMQVWTLYDPAVGPVSLGTLGRAREIRLKGPHLPLPKPDQLYEITLEPAPGSPTGKPTGPILVKGFATRPPA